MISSRIDRFNQYRPPRNVKSRRLNIPRHMRCRTHQLHKSHGRWLTLYIGKSTALFCSENLLNIFLGTTHYKEKKYSDALKHAFLEADVQLKDDPTHKLSPAGCTSVVSYFSPEGELYVVSVSSDQCIQWSNICKGECWWFEMCTVAERDGYCHVGRS